MSDQDNGTACDLVEIATIWCRGEMICFVPALRDNGIQTFVHGDHFGQATLHLVAIGGYRICVPVFEVERAVELIAELRGETEPLKPNVKRVRQLFGAMIFAYSCYGLAIALAGSLSGLLAPLALLQMPMPMTMAGDYRNKRGKLVQMR